MRSLSSWEVMTMRTARIVVPVAVIVPLLLFTSGCTTIRSRKVAAYSAHRN